MFFFSPPFFFPSLCHGHDNFIFAENPSRIPKNNFLCDKTQKVPRLILAS